MAYRIYQNLSSLWVPGVILCAVLWFKPQVITALNELDIKPQLLFYTVGIAGLVLSWRFNRSRILLTLAFLFLAYGLISILIGMTPDDDVRAVSLIVGILISLNFLGIALLHEHGVMSRTGQIAAGVIMAEAVLALGLLKLDLFPRAAALLHDVASFKDMDWTSLSTVTLAAGALTSSVLFIRTLMHQSAIEAGLLVAFISVMTGVHFIGTGQTVTLFFVTAAVIMQVTIIQDSHARVYRDELTGLPARRAFDELLLRLGRKYVLAIVDIDHFKKVNDTYGHQIGDQALRYIASHLARVRGGARVFRYGGEEFVILFRGKSRTNVLPVVDQLCRNIAEAPFIVRSIGRPKEKPHKPLSIGKKLKLELTVSIGVAECNDKDPNPEDVLKTADRRLYRAKDEGRNRVMAPRKEK